MLSGRREVLDDVETSTAYAEDMSEFLKTSELTESRAFIESFVKETVVSPGNAVVVYAIPTPKDSPLGGADAAEVALNGRAVSTGHVGGLIGALTHKRPYRVIPGRQWNGPAATGRVGDLVLPTPTPGPGCVLLSARR